MSFNIVDLVKDQITDSVLQKAGGLLGGDADKLSAGMESGIPALLGGLMGAASAPGKSGALFDAVNNSDDGLLNDFAGALGGGNSQNMIDQGSGVLSGLLGSGMMGGLGSVLSSVTGMSRGSTGSLVGMLAPVILGVLKKQVIGGGLDAGGLLSMLQGQKSNIGKAMPANFSSQLGNIEGFPSFDGLPDVSGVASGVSGAASSAVGTAASGVEAVGNTAQSAGGGIFKWLVPAAVALGLGWLAFTFLGKKDVDVPDDVTGAASEAVDSATDAATGAADAATDAASSAADAVSDAASEAADELSDGASNVADAVTGDFDLEGMTGNVTGFFNQASETLGGVTDVESATAALPGLQELGNQATGLSDLFDKVPDAARGPLQGVVDEGLGSLQPIVDKVMGIPGVGGVVGPVLEPILKTLGGLAG